MCRLKDRRALRSLPSRNIGYQRFLCNDNCDCTAMNTCIGGNHVDICRSTCIFLTDATSQFYSRRLRTSFRCRIAVTFSVRAIVAPFTICHHIDWVRTRGDALCAERPGYYAVLFLHTRVAHGSECRHGDLQSLWQKLPAQRL